MTTTAKMAKAVSLFEDQAGYDESRCSASVGNNTKFGIWYGMNCAAWCAMSASWAYYMAEFPQPASTAKGFAYTPSGAGWYQGKHAWSGPGENPERGWVVFFYSASAGRIAHVGLVRGPRGSDGMIPTVEGNTNGAGSAEGGSVLLKRRNPSQSLSFRIAGYGRPDLLEKEKEWWEVGIPESELEKIEAASVEGMASTPGQAALRKAFAAEVSVIVAATGANQFFIRQTGTSQVYVVGHSELFHVPSQEALYALGGSDAGKRILEYPASDPIWETKLIWGQQPGQAS